MPMRYTSGDLLHSNCDIIAHGCNCFNTMGKGVAAAMRRTHPLAFQADQRTHKGSRDKLGSYTMADSTHPDNGKPVTIFNLYIQHNYGRDGTYLSYPALEQALNKLKTFVDYCDLIAAYHKTTSPKVGLPRIGCDLSGGSWPEVERIIANVFDHRPIYIYTL